MTETDIFCFSKLKVFDSVKENLPDDAKEIMDVYEDLLFIWNFKSNNLRVINWRSAKNKEKDDVKYQVSCYRWL